MKLSFNLSLFLNTLSGQMLKNFKENGMLPGGLCIGSYGDPSCKNKGSQAQSFDSGAGLVVSRAAACKQCLVIFDHQNRCLK